MAEEKDYEVKALEKKVEVVEAIVDKEIGDGQPSSQASQTTRKGFQVPQIPTDKIFKTLTDRELLRQTWHDETMEPHIHLIKLLLLVFVLAIIIGLLGSVLGI
ncbi:MAG: hypothetical protein JSV09_09485 [Thermoplasmata archaeon]|nr:MAG: hypothetical protein JSV09_09485 [Thermoplasmata archaeon]